MFRFSSFFQNKLSFFFERHCILQYRHKFRVSEQFCTYQFLLYVRAIFHFLLYVRAYPQFLIYVREYVYKEFTKISIKSDSREYSSSIYSHWDLSCSCMSHFDLVTGIGFSFNQPPQECCQKSEHGGVSADKLPCNWNKNNNYIN